MDNQLSQFLDYCDNISHTATQATNTIPASWLTWYGTFQPTTLFDLPSLGMSTSQATVLYKSINITSTLPAYFVHISAQSLISTHFYTAAFSEIVASVASAASVATVTGDATSLLYSVLEDTSRPSWFSSATPLEYTAELTTLDTSLKELRAATVSITSSSPAATAPEVTSKGSTSTGIYPAPFPSIRPC